MTGSKLRLSVLVAASLAAVIAGTAAPASAEDRRFRRPPPRVHHVWRPAPGYIAPAPVYAPPAVVYAPPPAPVYAPPIAPSVDFQFRL